MDHFAGLDVSVKETSVCIVDETGKIVREVKVASEPDALVEVLTSRTEPEIIADEAVELARQLKPFMPGAQQGRRGTEHASFVRGHGLARLPELNEHRYRQQAERDQSPGPTVSCKQAHFRT
jgi:hypothetical protein